MTYNTDPIEPRSLITVVETPQFIWQAAAVWSDGERRESIDFIAHDPEACDIIPETGGTRKVRWRRRGTGKRGGVRVICFYHNGDVSIFLLMVHARSMRADVAPVTK